MSLQKGRVPGEPNAVDDEVGHLRPCFAVAARAQPINLRGAYLPASPCSFLSSLDHMSVRTIFPVNCPAAISFSAASYSSKGYTRSMSGCT
jgi:hypothetical protein